MPSELHADLAKAAERDGVSLNQLIVGLLSRSLVSGSHDDGAAPESSSAAEPAPVAPRESRMLRYAIAANLVVLVVAGAIAVGLLIVALRDGVG